MPKVNYYQISPDHFNMLRTIKKVFLLLSLMLSIGTSVRAENSLTLYGIIDTGLQYLSTSQKALDGGTRENFFGVANGVQSGSRWGLRGIHDMGNGNQTLFVLESGFNSVNGQSGQGGLLFGRQATLSYKNTDLGQLDLGRQINLASNYLLAIDPFEEGFGQANIGASFGSANTIRYSNMLLFQTRPLEGLTLGLGYSFATEVSGIYTNNGSCVVATCRAANAGYQFESGNNLRAVTLGATYAKGPLLLAAAYDQLQGPNNIPDGPPKPNPTAWLVAGAYNFQVAKVSVAYGQTRNGAWGGQLPGTGATNGSLIPNITLGADAIFTPGTGANSYFLGANIPVTPRINVLASVQLMQPSGDSIVRPESATQAIYSVGYTYNFTRRTNLYTYASYGSNYSMVKSAQSSVAGVGIRHQF
jgi:predicted porin